MLVRQDGGRDQHRDLLPVRDRAEGRADRDLGLSVADVAANQAIHHFAALEILEDVLDSLKLIRCLIEREFRLELPEKSVAWGKGNAGPDLSLGIELNQID